MARQVGSRNEITALALEALGKLEVEKVKSIQETKAEEDLEFYHGQGDGFCYKCRRGYTECRCNRGQEENELPLFKAFRHRGTRFLGVRRGSDGLHIVDEHGNNYGVWSSVDKFREFAGKPGGASIYGVNVRFDVYSEAKR